LRNFNILNIMPGRAKSVVLWLLTMPRDKLRWSSAGNKTGEMARPCLFYGFDRLPATDDHGSGGIIKVQDLQRVYPNTPRGANLLYLISSSPPLFAARLVRFARAAGARFVLNQNGVAYSGWHGPGWERPNMAMRGLLDQADYTIYQSKFCKETADHFLGKPQGNWEILYNPVDTEVFKPSNEDRAPGEFVVLVSGSHGAWYRLQAAIETLAVLRRRIPRVRMIVAGRYVWRDDPEVAMAEAKMLAARLGVADLVEFSGPYSQSAAVALFHRADVLLHTKYNDPCPRLVVEAMACGLPVIYSATGGTPELVGDSAGVGIPAPLDFINDHPPAPEALADALQYVAGHRAEFAGAARHRAVQLFDVRPWLRRHEEIFQHLLKRPSS
jgi:glycosyltransferase involved in cell wall biosynthesis